MKKQFLGIILLCSAIFLGSCKKESRIDELKEFIEQVKHEGSHYTSKQWEEVNKEFSKLLEKVENYEDLTSEEMEEIARLQGEYAATAFKNQAGEAMKKAGAIINGFIDGLSDNDGEDKEANKPKE